jgi:hypothetical protein
MPSLSGLPLNRGGGLGVHMKRRILLAGVSALLFASAAQAQVAVYVWTGLPDGGAPSNATLAQSGYPGAIGSGPLGPANVTGTVGGINFTDGPGFDSNATTVGQFLGNPGLSSATLNDAYFLFTGSIYLESGVNTFDITHDDGVALALDNGAVVSALSAGPTSPTTTPFTITAPSAGTYNFALSYGECCGGPAVLNWSYLNGVPVGNVPEPATWAMMLIGFAGIGFAMRTRRRTQLAQIA